MSKAKSHILGPAFDTEKIYGRRKGHPPTMTRTERLRFIRTYYQLWSLLSLCSQQQRQRMDQITSLKQLYLLREMCMLPHCLGDEAANTNIPFQPAALAALATYPRKREDLRRALTKRLDNVFRAGRDGKAAEKVEGYAIEDGYLSFVVIWDHWQENLKVLICGLKPAPLGHRASELEREELWSYETDEES